MANDSLSAAEIETLLAMNRPPARHGDDAQAVRSPHFQLSRTSGIPQLPAAHEGHVAGREGHVASREDVSPQRVRPELLRHLETMHDALGRRFADGLTSLVRVAVDVRVGAVVAVTYRDFLGSLASTTCLYQLRAAPLGPLQLDLSPAIIHPIIERLLGGGREPAAAVRRALTPIELRLASRVTSMFLKELESTWKPLVAIELAIQSVESVPMVIDGISPRETVVVIDFDVSLDQHRGPFRLCLPWPIWEPQASKLIPTVAARNEGSPGIDSDSGKSVALAVHVASVEISSQDLIDLQVGDIIKTDQKTSDPMTVIVDGAARFVAQPGTLHGRTAVQITSVLDMP